MWGDRLLVLVILEASFLASGRLVQLGPITLKMLLFAIAQVYVFCSLASGRRNLKMSTLLLISSFLCALSAGILIGIVSGAKLFLIEQDVKPLSYCCMVVFFDMTIQTVEQVKAIAKIFKYAAVLLSLGSLAFVAAIYLGLLPFNTVYALANLDKGDDIMFRGSDGLFLYKGAVYIGIGIILFAFDRGVLSRIGLLLGIVALWITNTRGFFVALAFVAAAQIVINRKHLGRKLVYAALCSVVAVFIYLSAGSVADRDASDQLRKDTIDQVMQAVNPFTVFVGHGFGNGVPERPVHMEPAILEIFHKEGILGVSWWSAVLAVLWFRFREARKTDARKAEALLLCALFVVFESLTNPYMNNPIGMTIWMVSLAGLDAIKRPGFEAANVHRQCVPSPA